MLRVKTKPANYKVTPNIESKNGIGKQQNKDKLQINWSSAIKVQTLEQKHQVANLKTIEQNFKRLKTFEIILVHDIRAKRFNFTFIK